MQEVFHPTFTITLKDGGVMKGELYPEYAPQSVGNFTELANKGFYDGLIFHRVIPDFMIQGGDPKGTGMGGPGYSIVGEFAANGFRKNTLKHTLGVISMARSMRPDSAGSQFFIMTGSSPPPGWILRGFRQGDRGRGVCAAHPERGARPEGPAAAGPGDRKHTGGDRRKRIPL